MTTGSPKSNPLGEAALYGPVKAFLEGLGYAVKGEVRGCDLVARRAGEPPVIVELKLRFTLGLVLQGIDRLAVSVDMRRLQLWHLPSLRAELAKLGLDW